MLVEDRTLTPREAGATPGQARDREAARGLMPVWAWAGLGLLGSVLVAFEGTHLLGAGAPTWWFVAGLPSTHVPTKIVFWVGVAMLCAAWVGLGVTLKRSPAVPLWALWVIGACWCLPFMLGPPLFSRDVYSYLAQGMLVHLGHSPYREAPAALAHLGQQRVLNGVDPFWRTTTAPYGPLFLGVVSLIVSVTGSQLVVGAIVIRVFDVIGLVLAAIFVPRLARCLGADPRRALWLAVLSPLVWLHLVSPAHNDLLMVGLMVAGVTLAVQKRPLPGIVVCAIAATIKVPAAAAIVFIAVAWMRALPSPRARLVALGKAVFATVAVAALVTLVTGLGLGWISAGLFSTPARVRLSITPATALGYTIAHLLHHVSVPLNGKAFEATLGHVAFGIAALITLLLLYRTRAENMVRSLGFALFVVAIGGPAAWPWYFIWALVLLAACPSIQGSRSIVIAIVVSAFIVIPNGQLALTLGDSPEMLVVFLLLGVAAYWYNVRRRRDAGAAGVGQIPASQASMLAEP